MDRLLGLRVFREVATRESFAGAARALGLSAPSATRAVAELEARLGVPLFRRSTRRVALTEAGARFLAETAPALDALDAAERGTAGAATEVRGHLTVTASVTLGRGLLWPVVAEFLTAHPKVTCRMLLVDRVVDLLGEGVDVAVRIGPLPDSGLTARRIGSVKRMLVASPGYLDRAGIPARPQDLPDHRVIAFTGLMPGGAWRPARGAPVTLVPWLAIDDAAAAIALAEQGAGITIALSYMVADALRAGRLRPVLAAHGPDPVPVHLVHAEGRLIDPKTRAFLDFAAPRLRQALTEAEVEMEMQAP